MTAIAASYVQTRIYMDTAVTIEVSDPSQAGVRERVERAFGWFREVEQRCSRFDPASELRRLCEAPAGGAIAVSPLLFQACAFALSVAEASDGAFDPTVGRAMERRGFNRNYRSGAAADSGIPDASPSYRDVILDAGNQTVTLRRRLLLDLGAVAKGLAIDLAAEELRDAGGFAVNAGGDIRVEGMNTEGRPWRIDIKNPLAPAEAMTSLSLTGAAVCTSGGYERPATTAADGHHIVTPASGRSPRGAISATVIAPGAMIADALSTAAFVLGPDAGARFVASQGAEALIVGPDLDVETTRGFRRYLV